MFKILFVIRSWYGERIFKNVGERKPEDWILDCVRLPENLPRIIEDENQALKEVGSILFNVDLNPDLMVFLGEGANASQLVPIIARKIEPKAIIVPVDAYEWLPRGLERQIAEELRLSLIHI